MLTDLFSWLINAVQGSVVVALTAAFFWGILSVLLSPCHLSSIPLIIGFIDKQGRVSTKRAFLLSFMFAFGILITIAAIGLITTSLGRLMGDVGHVGNYLVAIVFVVVGLYLLDIIKLEWVGFSGSSLKKRGWQAALILGLLFGIGLGPCTFAYMAPMLGVAFRSASTNFIFAILLLIAYGVGNCLVIVLAGTLTGKVQQYLNWTEKTGSAIIVRKICGILVILGGIYLVVK